MRRAPVQILHERFFRIRFVEQRDTVIKRGRLAARLLFFQSGKKRARGSLASWLNA